MGLFHYCRLFPFSSTSARFFVGLGILVAFSFWGLQIGQSAEPGESGDLSDYIEYGIAHNPQLQANYRVWQAALQRIPQATSLPDPKVTATHLVEDIQTRTGPQRQQVFVGQQLPWFGKLRLRGRVASREAEAIHHAYDAAVLETARKIGLAYYDYGYLGEATKIMKRVVSLLDRLEQVVREKVRGGKSLPSLLKMEIETAKARDLLQEIEKKRVSQSQYIVALLGSSKTMILPFPGLVKPGEYKPDRAALLQALADGNPELKSLKSRVDQADEAVKLSRLNGMPDPTIGAGFFDTGPAVNPGTPGSGNDPWSVQLSFNIPLWKKRNQAERREAWEMKQAARQILTDRQNRLQSDLDTALQDLSTIDRRLDLYGGVLLPKARQAMEVTETSYQSDQSSILDLIDAERTFLEIERNYWKAVSEHYKAQIRLQTITGKRPRS